MHVADGLAATLPRRLDADVGAHPAQHVDEAEPGRVDRHRLDRDVGTRRDQRRDDEERGRRRIARNLERERFGRSGAHAHVATVDLDGNTQRRQHAFAVIATRRGRHDLGRARRLETREHERRLHLRARDRQLVPRPSELPAMDDERCVGAAGAAVDACPHGTQWLGHTAHRTLIERRVAGQHRKERPAGQHPRQETHRGTAVAAVEHAFGLAQPAEAGAHHAHRIGVVLDLDAERLERGARRGHVVPGREVRDRAGTARQRRENQRTVRDRLVTGQPQRPA